MRFYSASDEIFARTTQLPGCHHRRKKHSGRDRLLSSLNMIDGVLCVCALLVIVASPPLAANASASSEGSWFGRIWKGGSSSRGDGGGDATRRREQHQRRQSHSQQYSDLPPSARRAAAEEGRYNAARHPSPSHHRALSPFSSDSSHSKAFSSVNPALAEEHVHRLSLWEAKATVSPCWRSAVASFRNKCGGHHHHHRHRHANANGHDGSAPTDSERSMMAMALMNCQLETDGKARHACGGEGGEGGVGGWTFMGFGGTGDAAAVTPEAVQQCVGALSDGLYPIYIQFRIHLDALCFFIGEEIARERMERATRDLHSAADTASNAVARMEMRAAEVEDRMEVTTTLLLERFDGQLDAAQQQVQSLAAMTSTIAQQHQEALEAAARHQASMHGLIVESSGHLKGQRGMLEDILTSATNLTAHTQEQHHRMALSNGEMLTILDRVYAMQTVIADSFGLLQMVGVYSIVCAVIVIVTLPRRTASARPWALLTAAAGVYVEYHCIYGHPLPCLELLYTMATTPIVSLFCMPVEGLRLLEDHAMLSEGSPPSPPSSFASALSAGTFAVPIVARLWRRCVLFVIAFIALLCAYLYESQEARLRRIVHAAFERIVEGQQGGGNGGGMSGGGGRGPSLFGFASPAKSQSSPVAQPFAVAEEAAANADDLLVPPVKRKRR